jgi:hypothetical protein
MGLRFRRRFSILPGLRLNLSRSGVSTSFGRRGLWVTYGKRGRRLTVGLPGSGLSYTSVSKARSGVRARPGSGALTWALLILLVLVFTAWWRQR